MKQKISLVLLLLLMHTRVDAQYDRNKLIDILTGGSSKSWTVKGTNLQRPEKSFTFNKNMSVKIDKDNGKGNTVSANDHWSLSSTDNIRWFIGLGGQSYEMIVSYSKNGTQYVKLTHRAGNDSAAGYYEINLYPQ